MTVAIREYGWSADGKTAAEISSDIQDTRYRLETDIRDLRDTVSNPSRLVPAVIAAGLSIVAYLIRRKRRKHR